jgi:hypothetical protein
MMIEIPAGTATDEAGNEVPNYLQYLPVGKGAELKFWFVCSGWTKSKKGRNLGAMMSLPQLEAEFASRKAGPWHKQLKAIKEFDGEFEFGGVAVPAKAGGTPTVSGASASATADPEVIKLLMDKPEALKQYLAGFVK